jgi:AraC family transcriptional activator of pobA
MKKELLPIFDIDNFEYKGNKRGFYANGIATHLKQYQESVLKPHRHNFYLSVLFTKGSGKHQIEFNNYEIKPGAVFMIVPGQVHNWQPSKDVDGYVFFHTTEFFNLNFTFEKVENYPFYTCLRNSPQIVLKKPALKTIEPLYHEIVEEYHQNELMKFQRIASLINALYISLSREYMPGEMQNAQHLSYLTKLKKLEGLVDENFKTEKYPKAYAQMMHMSVKHLNRISKICIDKTVSEIISDRIILEAKRIMAFSKHNISEIIDELGYEDNSYFSRLFKKKTGKTPLEYMKQQVANP